MAGAPRIGLFATDTHHGSLAGAVKMVGFGLKNLHRLPADELVDAVDGLRTDSGSAGEGGMGAYRWRVWAVGESNFAIPALGGRA